MAVGMLTMPDQASDAHFAVKFDANSRMVRNVIQGFWTNAVVDAYGREFKACADMCRERTGRLNVVIDARKLPIQSRDITARIMELDPYVAGDHVAIVLDTALAKISARRHVDARSQTIRTEIFDSIEEAERWLQSAR